MFICRYSFGDIFVSIFVCRYPCVDIQAHTRNLSIGLKNDLEQLVVLEPFFDWAINECEHNGSHLFFILPILYCSYTGVGVLVSCALGSTNMKYFVWLRLVRYKHEKEKEEPLNV